MCPTGTNSASTGGAIIPDLHLRTAFDALDADGDGKISYDDLRASYGDRDEDGMIRSMMSVADSNKDGYVEYDEFEKILDLHKNSKKNEANAGGRNVMEAAFRVMDKDGDGRVGHQDLKAYLNWAGIEADDDDVRAMITLGDAGEGVTLEALLKILAF